MRVCNLGCLVITLVWQSHVKPTLSWSPTASLPACRFFPASIMFSTFSSSYSLNPPLPPTCSGFKCATPVSEHQSRSFTSFISRLLPLIWQAWNIEENVNICFLVTGQVHEIHLYWWTLRQGFDDGCVCVWSRGDLFYPKSILFWSANVKSACMCAIKDLCACMSENMLLKVQRKDSWLEISQKKKVTFLSNIKLHMLSW